MERRSGGRPPLKKVTKVPRVEQKWQGDQGAAPPHTPIPLKKGDYGDQDYQGRIVCLNEDNIELNTCPWLKIGHFDGPPPQKKEVTLVTMVTGSEP